MSKSMILLRKNKILYGILAFLFVLGTLFLSTEPTFADSVTLPASATAADLQDAIDNSTGDTEITIDGTMDLDGPITIPSGKNITFVGSGTIKLADSYNGREVPFTIENGATMTIDGVTIDGNGDNVFMRGRSDNTSATTTQKPGSFIYCDGGTLNLKSGSIQNVTSKQTGYSGSIIMLDDNSTFNMSGGEITNLKYQNDANSGTLYLRSIIGANKGTVFNLSGGSINNNAFDDSAFDITKYDDVDYCREAVVHMHAGSTLNMSGGAIENNHHRGVIIGGLGNQDPPATTFNMTGGEIKNNNMLDYKFFRGDYSRYPDSYEGLHRNGYLHADAIGGGVLLYHGDFNLDGGTISGNKAIHGGGVAVFQVNSQNNPSPAKFTMTSGDISENEAYIGGGLFVSSSIIYNDPADFIEEVLIKGGTIKNNIGKVQGGGLYAVEGCTIRLENVIVHDNEASVMGGGIWGCPTSNVYNYVNNGGAIYDNDACDGNGNKNDGASGEAGDDIASIPQYEGHELLLSDRMLGGGKAEYYADGHVVIKSFYSPPYQRPDFWRGDIGKIESDSVRYDENNKGAQITGVNTTSTGYALHTDYSGDAVKLAEAMHKVEITGNYSERGGGIGTNGNIYIGTDGECKLNVKKEWAEDYPADLTKEAEIALCVPFNGKEYVLDTVTLTEAKPEGSFTGLPAGEYYVKELNVPGQTKVNYTIGEKTISADAPVSLSVNESEKEILITNKKKNTQVKGDPPVKVQKRIEGQPNEDKTFTFVMKPKNPSYPLQDGAVSGETEVNIVGEGEQEFGDLDFTQAGTYEYTVTEKNTGETGYVYDETVYTVRYEVTEVNGDLVCTRTIFKGEEATAATQTEALVFTNKYEASGTSGGNNPQKKSVLRRILPIKTGDTMSLTVWIGLLAISLLLLLAGTLLRKRRRS